MKALTKDRLRSLVERILAYESRQILIELNIHSGIKHKYPDTYKTGQDEIKREIQEIYAANIDTFPTPVSLKRYAVKFLQRQVRITDTGYNPSFTTLLQRIEKGDYDILEHLGIQKEERKGS